MSTPASPNKYPKRENIPVGIVPGSVLICMWDTPWNFFVQKVLKTLLIILMILCENSLC